MQQSSSTAQERWEWLQAGREIALRWRQKNRATEDELAALAPKDPEPEPWRRRAACREVDPEIFFPEKGESGREAKAVCRGCPVQPQCLQYVESRENNTGVWGGTTERERRAARRAHRGETPEAAA